MIFILFLNELVKSLNVEDGNVPVVVKPIPMLIDKFEISVGVFSFEAVWDKMSDSGSSNCHVVHAEVTDMIEFMWDRDDNRIRPDCFSFFVACRYVGRRDIDRNIEWGECCVGVGLDGMSDICFLVCGEDVGIVQR